jgi:ethanolamine utilization protein EutN
MIIARVTGLVVATQKNQRLHGQKLYMVEPLNVQDGSSPGAPHKLMPSGKTIVALDTVGCGQGQVVLVVQGSSGRMTDATKDLPADAVLVGIVDEASMAGKTVYATP